MAKGTRELGLGAWSPRGRRRGGRLRQREQPAWKGHRGEYFLLQKVVKRTCYTFSSVTEHPCTWHTVRPWGTKITGREALPSGDVESQKAGTPRHLSNDGFWCFSGFC